MSLLEDLKQYYADGNHYPPEGDEFEPEAEQVAWNVIDDSPRWGNVIQAVYKRGDELVAVQDVEPATEMQDWGDYGEPRIYPVMAKQVTVTKYVKLQLEEV